MGVCTHSQSEQCEALCAGSSYHYWSGREGVVIRTPTTTPSCPDHYCSSYKVVLLHTAPLVAESYNFSYGLSALAACAEEAIGDDAEATEHHQPASKHRIE